MRPTPDPTAAGQESVWSYPRPAIAELSERRIIIVHRGITLADTRRAVRTLETSHPPSYYFPPDDVDQAALARSSGSSFCEWKGAASYFDVTIAGEIFRDVAWSYARPTPAFASLCDHVVVYATPFDQCLVDGERVTPQPGDFYGGWITSHVAGPFKGVPAAVSGDAGSRAIGRAMPAYPQSAAFGCFAPTPDIDVAPISGLSHPRRQRLKVGIS